MTKVGVKTVFAILVFLLFSLTNICAQNAKQTEGSSVKTEQKQKKEIYKVTFIELGSVRCVPCQQMQPVMKSIKEKYGKQANVIFYDVWTPEGRPYAEKYGVTAIPTQVFLDENGKEFFRHEGYFPEEELVKVLKTKGVK